MRPVTLMRFLGERSLWPALVVGLLALTLAYQSPRSLFVDIGGPFDAPHTPDFHAPEQSGQATFRWSAAHSTLLFQGVGKPSSPFTVRLQLSSGRGPGSPPLRVDIAANDHPLPALQLNAGSASYALIVDPSWIGPSGDLRLDFASPTFKSGADRRDLGFNVDFARVELPAGLTLPSVTQLLWLLLCAALIYVCLRAVWLRPQASGALTLLFLMACAAVVAVQRLLLTVFSERLAATLFIALVVAFAAETATRWLARLAGWRGERSLPEWAWIALRALLLATVVLKVGGLLYPHTVIVDAYFHIKYITYMSEGRSWEQFFGKNLSLAVMPKEEWGAARAFIPYSPFFYVIAAPLAKLPINIAITVPVFSGILDALKVPMVFLLGLALGGPRTAARRAVIAAAVYTFTPATFLLQQWGNWPTLTSLWLVTLWATTVCLFWHRLTRLPTWLATTAILTLAMLSYTVTAAYIGVFISVLVALGLILAPGERRRWLTTGLSLAVAALASVLIFYGQYIGVVLNETLPTFGQAVEQQGSLTTLRPTLGVFLTDTLGRAMQSYNLAIVYALGLAGAFLLLTTLRRRGDSGPANILSVRANLTPSPTAIAPWQSAWLGAWLLTFPLFTLLDYWVDQALKEFWFALPAIAVVAGAWLLAVAGRRLAFARYLVWILGATLAWQSISLWVFRLLFHNR
jgi:hypothetical protein